MKFNWELWGFATLSSKGFERHKAEFKHYNCDKWLMAFKKEVQLRDHIQNQHVNKYVCNICEPNERFYSEK